MTDYDEGISEPDDFIGSLATGYGDAGNGKTFEDALKDAYDKGKGKNPGARCFRVIEIQVCGTNPITDYKVIVAPM